MTTTHNVTKVTLPALGDNVTEATITRWLKVPGDRIDANEPLLEVATDKVDTEVPSPNPGVLLEILAPEGAVIEIGAPLAYLDTSMSNDRATSAVLRQPSNIATADTSMSPSGPQIIERVAPPLLGADRVETLPRIRRSIANRMLESLQNSAQLTSVVEVDVTAIAHLRAEEKENFRHRTGVKLSFFPFFAAAAVATLSDHPVINASLDAECTEVTYYRAVHLGMAVDNAKGLMVPVLRDADKMRIPELARAIASAAESVRDGTIRPDNLTGGTFTLTNTGSRGALFDTPIINQPQSAILGIGAVVDRLVPSRQKEAGLQIDVRAMAYLSLSYDHRIVDGADAARYLTAVKHRIELGFSREDLE
ncbi:2-oxo acid dehydrogenase subunit E2 [Rhodococcus sp. ARC_M8]|uniref:2-oxo acid dehydrogenase subunit E2 n=1 Tax=Rhodococcus sp. ARC_M8 TaxID=2928853 RepID=UPI001FB5303B|nr:2-oxo acid dehydrogenase subunit E2 [Rhodococcus sp. ARC_M8]MCJ0949980.1 2-oxo acid dehydrogenase subunit E2 [Rhodococcus sp. ARC_M8]